MSLAEKQHKFLQGTFGRSNSIRRKTLPFEKLDVSQLKVELRSRNVDLTNLKSTKKDLIPELKKVLRGIKRVPILLLHNPLKDLNQMGLARYEIVMVECMHDIACHIENILEELPNHIKGDDKAKFNEMLETYKAEKEKKRCCDKRKILLQLTQNLHYEIDGLVHRLLRTLSEIQRILYLGDDFRTCKEILRLHNSCFEHFVLLKKIMPIGIASKITRNKLYGKYKHNLLVHAPIQYRLVSGASINCEDEERVFNSIKSITQSTTNNKPGHVIGNLIVRQEVESACKQKYEFDLSKGSTQNDIQKIGDKLYQNEKNSHFSFDFIHENSADWQSHLERISDFLIFGENVWWEKNEFGFEFFDFGKIPQNNDLHPKVHHFRSSSIPSIISELEEHWNSVLKNKICIPTTYLGDNFFEDSSVQLTLEDDEEEDDYITDFEIGEYSQANLLDDYPVIDTVDMDQYAIEPSDEILPHNALDNIVSNSCEKIVEVGSSSYVINNPPLINDNINMASSSKDSIASNSYFTSEANAIYLVLGGSSELKNYDMEKCLFKLGKASSDTIESLKDTQSKFQQQVLKQVSTLKVQFENWERSFLYENNLSAPSLCDVENNSYIADIFRKIRIGNQLLRSWNISF